MFFTNLKIILHWYREIRLGVNGFPNWRMAGGWLEDRGLVKDCWRSWRWSKQLASSAV